MTTRLAEKRILVVEDEYLLAQDMCHDFEERGAVVVGPAPSVADALALIAADTPIDAAVLDVNLRGELAYPVADALLARKVPFVFTSGYDEAALELRYPRIPRCPKPIEFPVVVGVLAAAMAGAHPG